MRLCWRFGSHNSANDQSHQFLESLNLEHNYVPWIIGLYHTTLCLCVICWFHYRLWMTARICWEFEVQGNLSYMEFLLDVKRTEEHAKANVIRWFKQDGGWHGEEGEERDWINFRVGLIFNRVRFILRYIMSYLSCK